MFSLVLQIASIAVAALLALGLGAASGWLRKRSHLPLWIRLVPFALAILVFVGGFVGTSVSVQAALHGMRSVEVSEQAPFLAQGISAAMTYTVGGIVFAFAFGIGLVVVGTFADRSDRPVAPVSR